MACIIEFESDDGDSLSERWTSIDAFLSFAAAEGLSGRWTAYAIDDLADNNDSEPLRLDSGRL